MKRAVLLEVTVKKKEAKGKKKRTKRKGKKREKKREREKETLPRFSTNVMCCTQPA